jgi:hypothetical protein
VAVADLMGNADLEIIGEIPVLFSLLRVHWAAHGAVFCRIQCEH